ncbi:MAG: hypothetical protein SV775_17780 [Thermodesulfobacteriota bacterium]|nr:hypothetical protein [Thermodesulfobacteriota bacterium]
MTEKRGRYIIGFKDIPSKRHGMPELEVEQRKDDFEEVELGLDPDAAQEEARRCLSCRRCLGCELCLAACEPRAIVFDQEDEVIDLMVDEVIISPEVDRYIPLSQGEFGYLDFINVVNIFEFERILSEDGPYGGMLLRAFDGDIPQNIGFVFHDDAKGQENGNSLLSYTLQEAELAKKKVEDLGISIFISGVTDLEKVSREANQKGISTKNGEVVEVKESEETKNLFVKFMEGDNEREEEFEMLVISKPPQLTPELRELQKLLG